MPCAPSEHLFRLCELIFALPEGEACAHQLDSTTSTHSAYHHPFCARYNSGNRLRIRVGSTTSSYLTYTACDVTRLVGIGDAVYSTCWQGSFFTLTATSASSSITGFYVSGSLGARYWGSVYSGTPAASPLSGWTGFWKQAGRQGITPYVNHLILVNKTSGWTQQVYPSAYYDTDSVQVSNPAGAGGTSAIKYVLWGDPRGSARTLTTNINRLFQSVVNGCYLADPPDPSVSQVRVPCARNRNARLELCDCKCE